MTARSQHGRYSISERDAVVPAVALFGLLLMGGLAGGQPPPPPGDRPGATVVPDLHAAVNETDCGRCHTCDEPTSDNPCLLTCPRPRTSDVAREFARIKVPQGVILLNMLSSESDATDHFGPVPFDHSGHANWAEIAGGCSVCHHYTPEGAAHPACRSCHEVSFRLEDIRKPGLKGAYHRQCGSCHREWSHDTKCGTCHVARIGDQQNPEVLDPTAVTAGDVMGTMHPPIPEPEVEIYETDYPPQTGSKVYFHHERHSERYQFRCAECHRGDSCARCHEYGKEHVQRVRTMAEHHQPCSACHVIEGVCGHCHKLEGQPEPEPFDHGRTGWPLSRYHERIGCRTCHTELPFRRLERDCNGCHRDWNPDNFNHALTGQALDDNHRGHDCALCHADRDFTVAPTCSECHEEDESGQAITFPARRPGEVLGTAVQTR